MQYRRLGQSGLKVSELSYGSWVTYGSQVDTKAAVECMAAAWDAGVNFFDNAEAYAKGASETIMGEAIKQLGWRRSQAIISTKFFFLGPERWPERKEHAEPQVPHAGHRRLAETPATGLRRPRVLPSRRPEHAD